MKRLKKLHDVGVALIAILATNATPLWATHVEAAQIGNRDTRVTIRFGSSAPQVTQLSSTSITGWTGNDATTLIDHITIDGKDRPLHWHFNRTASRLRGDAMDAVYENDVPKLRLTWSWRTRAMHGPLEHTIRIQNLTGRTITLPLQDSFRFRWHVPASRSLQQLWIDKGAGEAPPVGTHLVDVGEGYRWLGTSSTYAHPRKGEPREIIPYMLVRSPGDDATDGWYVGMEFSGRVAMRVQRRGDVLEGGAGLNPEPGPFETRLLSGESFVTPTVFLGATHGSVDDAGNALRRWVREVLNDPRHVADPHYPLLVNNSWGSGMAVDAAQAHRMIIDSAALGFEMFHLDAGWFRGVGDWVPDPRKFPQGLVTIADDAHRHGLKFGLWIDWAQAGNSMQPASMSVLHAATRDWLVTDPPPGWKPGEFKGITIDIGQSDAKAWVSKEVERLVHDDHLDMLEHDGYVVAQGCDRADHPHATCDPKLVHHYEDEGFRWADGPNSTDVSYHAARAYYDIYRTLKKAHPDLLLEICNDGGRMVDFGSAAVGDYFSIVDSYDPLSNRQAFYDASHVLPSAMLETYVKQWPTPRIENFRTMLRSGMMGWFTLMLDTTRWTSAQRDDAMEELRVYKSTLRPLIRNADLYHVGPRPDGKGWDGTEYVDAASGTGVLYAFHGSNGKEISHRFVLKGLQPLRRYRLHFHDGSAADVVETGDALSRTGVVVRLPVPESSELVMLSTVHD
ncbi:alpha-galactosidase [Rhodanobacter sp. L36]|uniref:alpha-galactosidase n=1 Tax=Rhodanobacter sp. L36 TaxID=1747221 RepID=UPI00131E424F|nr:alpha-galactosidase [Rhodanobacter sp. L36]